MTEEKSRDVRLTESQLDTLEIAVMQRRRELDRRLRRSSYEGKPGMLDSILREKAELVELERIVRHNAAQLDRQRNYA